MSENEASSETNIISDDSHNSVVSDVPSTECIVSDSDSEEEIVVRPKAARRPVAVIDSDSSDDNATSNNASKHDDDDDDTTDDDEEDERALSPRTRMSITGVRPADLTDNSSSEIQTSEDSEVDESEEDGAHNSFINRSATANSSLKKTQELYSSPAPVRYSTAFKSGIKGKLSSTLCPINDEHNSSDSEVEAISIKNQTIEILSSDDDNESFKSIIEKKNISTKVVPSVAAFVQPKIQNAMPPPPPPQVQKPLTIQYVSPEFYEQELRKYEEIKTDVLNSERVLKQCGSSLPDKGRQLEMRIDNLRKALKTKAEYIAKLKLDEGQPRAPVTERKPFFNNKPPEWSELSDAVNQLQPTHWGKQGLATFNNQKALTIDSLKDLHGSLESCPAADVLADDPAGLRVKLMDHQRHALAWMAWREQKKPRGGILADDMGLGKTLTCIAMILAAKEREVKTDSDDDSENENPAWKAKGKQNIISGGTLVVCPASLMNQWDSEIKGKVARSKVTVCVHHGNQREIRGKNLAKFDFVLTTYQIVSREHKSRAAVFGVKWQRVILDEAHIVRNHKAQTSEAVCDLQAKYRWCLTGTPIQNKAMDVYALLKFLRCSPFDELAHWKRWIDNKSAGGQQRLNTVMKTLMLRRTKVELQAAGALQCLPEKTITLIEVTLDKDEMNVYQKVMIISRSLFAQFLIQHAERQTEMYGYRSTAALPTQMQNRDPNGAYYKIHQKLTKIHTNKEVKSHEILMLLLRLRQICCHPTLINAMLEDGDVDHLNVSEGNGDKQEELDLLEQLNKLALTEGNASQLNSLQSSTEEVKPSAQEEYLAKASARLLHRTNPVFRSERPSTKMRRVMETLEKHVLAKNDKAIIVSQWTSYLDLVQAHLTKHNIETLALDGRVPVKNRQVIVDEFNKEHGRKRVLLLSLTAGGVGLNLVGANHLFLLDLHWNPQLEAQAQDRIYRVGQKKNVVIYKFMCKDTVEERIKALQDRKLEIASNVLTGSAPSVGSKLTIDELKGLFDM